MNAEELIEQVVAGDSASQVLDEAQVGKTMVIVFKDGEDEYRISKGTKHDTHHKNLKSVEKRVATLLDIGYKGVKYTFKK